MIIHAVIAANIFESSLIMCFLNYYNTSGWDTSLFLNSCVHAKLARLANMDQHNASKSINLWSIPEITSLLVEYSLYRHILSSKSKNPYLFTYFF